MEKFAFLEGSLVLNVFFLLLAVLGMTLAGSMCLYCLCCPHMCTNPALALKVRKTIAGKESYMCRQGSAYTYPHNGPLVLP